VAEGAAVEVEGVAAAKVSPCCPRLRPLR